MYSFRIRSGLRISYFLTALTIAVEYFTDYQSFSCCISHADGLYVPSRHERPFPDLPVRELLAQGRAVKKC